ncbi:MAG: Crp/Fnr family transcriptional regulator [Bacteroidales bacterium]|nr:Crp/Fnr family transcriptional regulator [Bacteroidales bacterium]
MDELQNIDHLCNIYQEEYLTEDDLDELRVNSNVVTYEKPEVILRQNTRTSHIAYVKSGLVKVYKEGHNRRNFILKVACAGEFLGLTSVYGNELHQYSASALQTSEICFIDFFTFNKITQRNKQYAMGLIRLISEENLFILHRLMGQIHKQLPGRIADVILYFSETIFHNTTFEFPLSRKELAELAGTTKESFIRTLAEFKHDKIIHVEGSKVHINSLKIIHTLSKLG